MPCMHASLDHLPLVELPLNAAGAGTLPAFLAQAALEHGPIFRSVVPVGREAGRPIVFMVGPEANRFVLHTHRAHFSHDQGWTPVIGASVGQGLLNMDDPLHAFHRRLWNPAFAGASLATYVPVIQRVVRERVATWAGRGEVDVYDEARRITFDIAACALAGFEPGPDLDRLRDLFHLMFHGFQRRKETRGAFQRRKSAARTESDALMLPVIAARRGRQEGQPRDVLGMIVGARDEAGHALTDAQIVAHINILLVAGHETTTTLGAWSLFLLRQHPAYQERIEHELQSLPADDDPEWARALQALPTLDLFVREVGRLYAPVLTLPRGVVEGFRFGGYDVEAGSTVRLALAAGHHLPTVFGQPHRFDPMRFAPPREEDKRTPYGLITFGAGPRTCIGINVAQIETKTLIAYALRACRFDPAPDQRPIHAGFWVAKIPFGIRMLVRRHGSDAP
jgi:retinoid hydroxylase